jgi:hypothetical protein
MPARRNAEKLSCRLMGRVGELNSDQQSLPLLPQQALRKLSPTMKLKKTRAKHGAVASRFALHTWFTL